MSLLMPATAVWVASHRGGSGNADDRREALQLQDFFLLRPDRLVDLLDVGVGQLLDLVLLVVGFVLGDLVVLLELLDPVVGVAADVAHRDLGVLADVLDDLDQVLRRSSVRGGIGSRINPAVVLGVEPEVRRPDGLLDLGDEGAVPRLDGDHARVGGADVGDLLHGHHLSRSSSP